MLSAQSKFYKIRQNINGGNAKQLLGFLDSCLFKNYHRDSALFYKGLVNLRLNQNIEAIKYHHLLQEEFPEFWEANYLEGLICYVQKRYFESVKCLTIVLKKNKYDWRAYYDRALAFAQTEAFEAALDDLDACLRLNPTFAAAYYAKANNLEVLAQYDEAIMNYKKCLNLEAKNFDAYMGLAYAYQKNKQAGKACETINDAIKIGLDAAKEKRSIFCER